MLGEEADNERIGQKVNVNNKLQCPVRSTDDPQTVIARWDTVGENHLLVPDVLPLLAIFLTGFGRRNRAVEFIRIADLELLRFSGANFIFAVDASFVPKRRWLKYNWRVSDAEWIAEQVDALSASNRILVGGFSDGARVANLAASISGNVHYLVLHSGRWAKGDPLNVEIPTLVVGGLNDWTEHMPWPSNPFDFSNALATAGGDVEYRIHSGGHEWTEESTEMVANWMSRKTRKFST